MSPSMLTASSARLRAARDAGNASPQKRMCIVFFHAAGAGRGLSIIRSVSAIAGARAVAGWAPSSNPPPPGRPRPVDYTVSLRDRRRPGSGGMAAFLQRAPARRRRCAYTEAGTLVDTRDTMDSGRVIRRNMVGWYDPAQLWRTALEVIVAST